MLLRDPACPARDNLGDISPVDASRVRMTFHATENSRLSINFWYGAGDIKIIELARLYDIPIRQDKKVLQILSRLDLEEEIPPEVYKAVAEILAFIYRLSNRPMETSG